MSMFSKRPQRITIRIIQYDGDTVLAEIVTPAGTIEVLGEISFEGGEMRVTNAHVEGLSPGGLGRSGLNDIAEAIREKYNVDTIVVEGAARSTGANPGRKPRPIRYPRRP